MHRDAVYKVKTNTEVLINCFNMILESLSFVNEQADNSPYIPKQQRQSAQGSYQSDLPSGDNILMKYQPHERVI